MDIDEAKKTISEYCGHTEYCTEKLCKLFWWCTCVRKNVCFSYAYQAENYNTSEKLIDRLIQTGWKELKLKKNDVRVFQNYYKGGKLAQITVPVDVQLSDFCLAFDNALEHLMFFEQGVEW